MKKIMTLAMMMTIAISATAMTYDAARSEAMFLSDKMAYELGLTDAQYEAVYEINLDYLLNVRNRADVLGPWWDVRNRDLRLVLSSWQFDRYLAAAYFYRPLAWHAGSWSFAIYDRYRHGHMLLHRPGAFHSFRGGHSHRGTSFYAGRHFDRPKVHPGAHMGHATAHHPMHGRPAPNRHAVHPPVRHGGHGPSPAHRPHGHR